MEADRTPRIESCVNDLRPLSLGLLGLDAGRDPVVAGDRDPGREVPDVRVLVVRRVEPLSVSGLPGPVGDRAVIQNSVNWSSSPTTRSKSRPSAASTGSATGRTCLST